MSSCAVTLTANAGVVLEWRRHVIWIDALHTGGARRFPAVSPVLWQQMRNTLPPPELRCPGGISAVRFCSQGRGSGSPAAHSEF